MLAFCTAWLWFFRREYRFPQALVVVPIGVLAVFLLNGVRIAVLILIGDAGYERVATVGFHSQAGRIAFNLAAFGIAILAHANPWLSRVAAERRARRVQTAQGPGADGGAHLRSRPRAADGNPTAAYLMPLLAILAAGMIAHSPANAAWLGTSAGEPAALAALSPGLRGAWIGCRLVAAVVTVPLAEELAYRGYLLRRLTSVHFEAAPFSAARWPALAISGFAFGIVQGRFWIAGTIAGLAYGALAMRTNKLGESVSAHATTNAFDRGGGPPVSALAALVSGRKGFT